VCWGRKNTTKRGIARGEKTVKKVKIKRKEGRSRKSRGIKGCGYG